jgi:hypothetical protein
MTRYSDAELAAAVAQARSWRGVLRRLGLPAQSAGAMRSARRRADALGLDHRHFTGQRRWSDAELAAAVAGSRTWSEVSPRLGLAGPSGSTVASLRSHAARLGLDVTHLSAAPAAAETPFPAAADVRRLARAGPLLAASWFMLHGYEVCWPLEPCRYDLIVGAGPSSYRVQVKTTTRRAGESWVVRIAGTRRRGVAAYSPDEIDHFFVLDGELSCYVIPLHVVGGLQVIHLRRYAAFRVGTLRFAAA